MFLLIPAALALAGYGLHLTKGHGSRKAGTITFVSASELDTARTTSTSDHARAVRKSPDPVQIMELPEAERSLITGQGALDSASYFDCWVTNRGSWTVTELRLRIAAGQPEGSTRWERNYNERLELPPGAVRHIFFKVTDGRDAESRWKIIGARGVPPN